MLKEIDYHLQIKPIDKIPLEAAIEMVEEQVIKPLESQGLPTGMSKFIRNGELTTTWQAMV